MRRAIDIRRSDRQYAESEARTESERAKKTLMKGSLVLAAVGVLGTLALRTAGMLTGKRLG